MCSSGEGAPVRPSGSEPRVPERRPALLAVCVPPHGALPTESLGPASLTPRFPGCPLPALWEETCSSAKFGGGLHSVTTWKFTFHFVKNPTGKETR